MHNPRSTLEAVILAEFHNHVILALPLEGIDKMDNILMLQ
jgi:hypothetical protein